MSQPPYFILVAAPLSEEGLALLRSADDVQVKSVAEAEWAVLPHLPTCQALIVGDELRISDSLLEQAPHLKVIARAGALLTNIDLESATRRGIIVMNAPDVDAVTVAEYTFTLLLGLMRQLVEAHRALAEDRFQRDAVIGAQLKGKTLGILGFGRVGREVAHRALAFGMEVLVTDPYVAESSLAGLRVKLVGMDETLGRSDILTIHTSVIPETQGFLNANTLAKMKKGAFLVNIKHHSLMDAEALRQALDTGHLAGAALDDFEAENLPTNPLRGHPKVLHTQRQRNNTAEARRDLSTLLAPQLLDALRGHDYRNAVNLPFMAGREYEVIAPQLKLGEKIGMLNHYLGRKTAIERIEISIQGPEMQGLLKPLTVAILYGLLAPRLGENVNYINAPILANELGIIVTQAKGLAIDSYPNLLACRILWVDGFELVVAGAIFNQTEPRIVQLDQYRTDFVPDGTLLILGSYDVPGVIGKVGTFMAAHAINIAGWRTSRVVKGGNTLSVISIDEPLSEDLLNKLRANDFVRHATQIIF